METKYNIRSPAVKRLMKEAIELREPTSLYVAQPLEDNLFEWHFTIRGPPGSDYEGGVYHGRITLPHEYPMKPPSIILLTPNGRFEIGQKICLSASSHHPELWQASWGIRTILLALIGFMPTDGLGTIGSITCDPKERQRLAQSSLNWRCSTCGPCGNVLLPDTTVTEDNGDGGHIDNEINKEMNDIISNMTIKSEAQVEEEMEIRKRNTNRGLPPAPTGATPTAAPTHTTLTNATPPTQTGVTHSTIVQTNATPPNNNLSLLIIIILIIFIILLLARRILIPL